MIRKLMTGIAAAALLLPVAAVADETEEHGTFEMLKYEVGDNKVYAVANPADNASVVINVDGSDATLSTGLAAKEIIEKVERDIQEALPGESVVELDDNHKVRMVGDPENVTILKFDSDDGAVNVDEILKEHGIDWIDTGGDNKIVIKKKVHKKSADDGNVEVEVLVDDHDVVTTKTDTGKKRVVIRKHRVSPDDGVVIDLDTDSDVEVEVRKRVKVMKMPEPPEPPKPGSTNSKSVSKYEYEFSNDAEGDNNQKRFVRIKGADAKQASDFIDELDDISNAEKREMKEALGL